MSTGQEMQPFTLCCARVRGKNKNTFYPDDRVVHNLPELLEAVQFDHTPGTFTDRHRNNKTWCCTEFTPSHTLLLFTNFLPRVGSSDRGTWSRLTVLPFNAHLRDTAGEKKDYADMLYTQAGGAVLSWMVEGARRFIANGYKLTPPAVVREALADYRKSCDWLGGFLTECCELGENYVTASSEIYQRYTAHCQVAGEYRRDNRDFAHAMQNAGYERKHTMKGWQYYGLRLRSEFSQE